MRRFALALFLALLSCPAPASAQVDLSPAFGNTVVFTLANGSKAWLWFRADGGYAARLASGDSSGRWSVHGDQVCLRQMRPIFIPLSFCTKGPTGDAGASWTARAPSGEIVTLTLVRGQVAG